MYLRVAEGAMIPDIMHDLLEGVLPLEVTETDSQGLI